MKTIKEFRNAGLEISEKDLIDGITGDKGSRAMSLSELSRFWYRDAWQIREFAWRENTGEKPEFKGMVEWISNVGTNHTLNTNTTWWNSKMVKWRPLLNQAIPTETPEEKEELDRIFGEASGEVPTKPAYTQEMKANKQLPPIGSRFIDTEYSMDKDVLAIAYDEELKRVVYRAGEDLIDSEYFGATIDECQPITPPTPLIDGECYQFTYCGEELKGCYGDKCFYHSIVVARVSECTNIRQLTLGGK